MGNNSELNELYKKLIKRNRAARYYKADLHVHTPASKDFNKVKRENSDETEYKLLLERFIKSEIDIIAITDHNTSCGYFELKNLIEQNHEIKLRLTGKLILPGVEVTCYNKHFIVLFPEDCSKSNIDSFLVDCGVSVEEQGNEDATADRVSPLILCEKAGQYGGVIVLPHCDAEKGLLESYFGKPVGAEDIRGKSLSKILKSDTVVGMCCNSEVNLKRAIELKAAFEIPNVAIIRASDCHSSLGKYTGSGKPFGTRISWIKLGELSFGALCLALKNGDSRVSNCPPEEKMHPVILGMAIKGGFLTDKHPSNEWALIPFAAELNCVIGARGTGKSTMLDILKFLINPSDKELRKEVEGRFGEAIVFLKYCGKLIAAWMQPQRGALNRSFYVYEQENFKQVPAKPRLKNAAMGITKELPISDFVASADIQSYRQKRILELATLPFGPTFMIDSLCALTKPKEFKQLLRNIAKYEKNIINESKTLQYERKRDKKADLSSDYLENQFLKYKEAHDILRHYQLATVSSLNEILKDKLEIYVSYGLPKSISENMIDRWVYKLRREKNIVYEHQRDFKKLFSNIFKNLSEDWAVPFYIFTGKIESLAKLLRISFEDAEKLFSNYYDKIDPEDVILLPKLVADFRLNINHGISNRKIFKNRTNLSYGQRAVGMLLLILQGATELGENRPLVIDQPEDDLDNVYIYHTLVKEFLEIKSKRQLIIATHNPNIPIAGDSENILILNSNGDNGWIENSGCIERKQISSKVLQILEGDFEAFSKRAEKYGVRLLNGKS